MFYSFNRVARFSAIVGLIFSVGLVFAPLSFAQAPKDQLFADYFLPGEYPEATATEAGNWIVIWAAGEEDVDQEPMRFAFAPSADGNYVFTFVYRRNEFCEMQVRETTDAGQLNIYMLSAIQIDDQPLQTDNALAVANILRQGQLLQLQIDTGETLQFTLDGAGQVLTEAIQNFTDNPLLTCGTYGSD